MAARATPHTRHTKHGKPRRRRGWGWLSTTFLRRLERARAPSFADLLLAMPQDDGEFPREKVRMRDLKL